MDMVPDGGGACPCAVLTEPFTRCQILNSLDHVCWETLYGSVGSAIRDKVIPDPEADWWPVRVGDRRDVGLVIRQWVEDDRPPERKRLANQLAGSAAWRRTIKRIGHLHERGAVNEGPASDAFIARALRASRLPDTPSTVRYLRAIIAGKNGDLPAAGLLVTTLAFVRVMTPPDGSTPIGGWHPPHGVAVTGLLDLTTAEMWQRAGSAAHSHRRWLAARRPPDLGRLRGVGYYFLADRRAQWRARPGTAGSPFEGKPEQFSYLKEAIRSLDEPLKQSATTPIEKWSLTHPADLRWHLSEFFETVQKRVDGRCERAKRHRPSEPGWRREARREIAKRLPPEQAKAIFPTPIVGR